MVGFCKSNTCYLRICLGYIVLALCVAAGHCTLLGNTSFVISANSPIGNGEWAASSTCNLLFQGPTLTAGSSYILTRFAVPFKNGSYSDYLGGTGIQEKHAGNQWIVVNVGFSVTGGTLSYSFNFEYDVWLGSQEPQGECYLFNSLATAQVMAASMPIMDIPHYDPLLASSYTGLVSVSTVGAYLQFQFLCAFSFPGIRFGSKEASVFLNFTAPVGTYYVDYVGNSPLVSGPDNLWKIVSYTYAAADSAVINFVLKVSNEVGTAVLNNGLCYLYAREDSAVLAATSPTSTTAAPVPVVTSPPFVYVPVARSSTFKEVCRDRKIVASELWTTSGHMLSCSRKCHVDNNCTAIRVDSGQCWGLSNYQETGDDQPGSVVYEMQ